MTQATNSSALSSLSVWSRPWATVCQIWQHGIVAASSWGGVGLEQHGWPACQIAHEICPSSQVASPPTDFLPDVPAKQWTKKTGSTVGPGPETLNPISSPSSLEAGSGKSRTFNRVDSSNQPQER